VDDYLAFRAQWSRALLGERDLTWPGRPSYWVKTSGTTAGDKVLPITPEAFVSHRKGGWDAMLMAVERAGAISLLGGALLFPGGTSTRTAGVGMVEPRLIELPAGTFYRWMRERGQLGDQHKVPRVTNDRTVADRLLAVAARSSPVMSSLPRAVGAR
jgi:hypothetical protein